MKAKLDENVERSPQRLLERRGPSRAENVYDEERSGASDPEVWRAAQGEGRLLVTLSFSFVIGRTCRHTKTRCKTPYAANEAGFPVGTAYGI